MLVAFDFRFRRVNLPFGKNLASQLYLALLLSDRIKLSVAKSQLQYQVLVSSVLLIFCAVVSCNSAINTKSIRNGFFKVGLI